MENSLEDRYFLINSDISIVLSMNLSSVILNSALTYAGNIDLEKGLSDVIMTNYNVASSKYFRYTHLGKENSISNIIIKKSKSKKGFKAEGTIYSYGYEYSYPEIKIEDKKVAPILFGIDDYLINKQQFIQGKLDQEKWKTINYIIIGEKSNNTPSIWR